MPKPGIPDSTCKFFPDSGFYKHKLPGLGRSGLKGDAESNHRVGMTGLDPYSMVTLIYRLSGARNFLLQSSAKLTTGIPRANQKPTQDCYKTLSHGLAWALMRGTSGANKQPPCDSKLCGPVPNHKLREEVVRGVDLLD